MARSFIKIEIVLTYLVLLEMNKLLHFGGNGSG